MNQPLSNTKQVGGKHYKGVEIEHWDVAWMHSLDYFQGQITKYVMRWRDKNGIEDLLKAQHFLEKYIECITKGTEADFDAEMAQVNPFVMETIGRPGPHPDVKPSAWVGFVFEGTDADGSLFTCKVCKAKCRIPPDHNPHEFHLCGADVTKRYVDQD